MKGATTDLNVIVEAFIAAALEAGRSIMAIAAEGLRQSRKADGSPVTSADLAAEAAIRRSLAAALPDFLIIGEEGDLPPAQERLPDTLILVDPLDGTRDFLKGSREFTVNIALIRAHRPVAGVVHAPALGRLFAGAAGSGAFEMRVDAAGLPETAPRRAVSVRGLPITGPVAFVSRSHPDGDTRALLDRLAPASRVEIGSSLKFGLIAAGEGDLYARAISLSQWDIAAGDALLTAAGGAVLTHEGHPLRYGGASLEAEPFIAIGDPQLRPRILAAARRKNP